MFQDFAKRKFDDYLALLEFPAGRITFGNISNSSLPPFIISFIELYIPNHNIPVNKNDFGEILHKAIIFNINYIIKPKNTILKFLFGDVETRPVRFIEHRLDYFQFYGYYISQIEDFIYVNSLDVVSYNQIEHLINEVNKKILEEISAPGNDSHRMSLVKLPYYFFHDLGENNPINIKLPRKILSAYFQDKGFPYIKKRIDGFFSNEIFIQEAIELMNPGTIKAAKTGFEVDVTDNEIKEIITKAKTGLINSHNSNKEVEKILLPEESMPVDIPPISIKIIRDMDSDLPESQKTELVIDEEIYSDDLMFVSQFNDLTPPVQLTEEEKFSKLFEELFCEQTYRKKILKNMFGKSKALFTESVKSILECNSWNRASVKIEDIFNSEKIDFLSEEAVKFVDILQNHFNKEPLLINKSKAV